MGRGYETEEERQVLLSTIRQQNLKDVDQYGEKQRFALFSQMPPTAVGDNSYDNKPRPQRDENGKVMTMPPNVKTNPMKSGKTKKSFFSELSYITINDKYTDEYKQRMLDQMNKKSKQPKDVAEFRYSDGYKLVIKHPYPHKSDFVEVKKEVRDSNGKVICQPSNIKTSQEVKGLYKQPKHMKDEYDRYQQQLTKDRIVHQQIVKELPKFRSMDRDRGTFSATREIYYDDPKLRPEKEIDLKIFKHEVPFKPSNPPKIGYNKTLNKYPKYMGDPIKELVRQQADPIKKDIFKLNQPKLLNRPTPSVSFHPINIRKEMRRSCR